MKVQDLLLGNKSARNEGQLSVEEARKAMFDAGEQPKNYKGGRTSQELQDKKTPVVTQTPTVVRSAESQRNEEVQTLNGPTEFVALLTYVNGDVEEIVVKDKEELVAEVDARSKRLKDAGQPTKIQVRYTVRPRTEEATTPQPQVRTEGISAPKTTTERVETKDFTAEIRQDNGKWVGEIVYKNGAGTERFVAPTKNELTLKMLVGKANATVKVRKMKREQLFGSELDKSYKFEGLTQEQWDAMPAAAQQEVIDAAAAKAAMAFKMEHPEYISTEENWNKIRRFLDARQLPITYTNLEYAFDALTEDEELTVRTEKPAVVVAPSVEDSASVAETVQVAPAPAPAPASATPVRKRGTTGLQPGFSSAGNTELDATEDGKKSRELSEAELRALPLSEHKKLFRASLKQPNRQF